MSWKIRIKDVTILLSYKEASGNNDDVNNDCTYRKGREMQPGHPQADPLAAVSQMKCVHPLPDIPCSSVQSRYREGVRESQTRSCSPGLPVPPPAGTLPLQAYQRIYATRGSSGP